MERFGDFISGTTLNAEQEESLATSCFMSARTATSPPQDLINVELLSEVDRVGVFGAQTQGVGKFIRYIHDMVVA